MIIIKLQGGLGNQMFQYAIGRFLAEKNKTELKLDLSFYNEQQIEPQRKYSLEYFNIIENITGGKDLKKIKKGIKKLVYLIYKVFLAETFVYTKENFFHFDSNILKIKGDVYLDGYWQSEKYFQSIEEIIHKEFTLKNKLQKEDLINKINNSNSVSIHIRRDDYTNKKNYYVLTIEYYKEAIKIIKEKNQNIHLFVFSDDINWVKNNLKTEFPITFIDGNKDYEDLILMSMCKHNIIANSSFSWWGAWLNQNPHKIVIAPKKWFNKPEINTKDLIPESWLKI